MRGRDEDTGEFHSASRSQQRRDALDVLALAQQLATIEPGRLAKLPVPDHLLPHIAETKRITSHIARKRQLAFLAKQMRREDDAVLDAIRDALDAGGHAAREETALLHRLEAWRARLLEDGDAALAALVDEYPGADRQRLRQLVRNSAAERKRGRPPHAYRELFRELRSLLAAGDAGDADGIDDAALDGTADGRDDDDQDDVARDEGRRDDAHHRDDAGDDAAR